MLPLQEKTTAALLERAYKIKEDLIDNLNFTHGTWQDEKQARELLQEHIRTITDVVRKLSRDIGVHSSINIYQVQQHQQQLIAVLCHAFNLS